MGSSSQESWSGLPFPPPGYLLDPGMEPMSPALADGSFTAEPPGKPSCKTGTNSQSVVAMDKWKQFWHGCHWIFSFIWEEKTWTSLTHSLAKWVIFFFRIQQWFSNSEGISPQGFFVLFESKQLETHHPLTFNFYYWHYLELYWGWQTLAGCLFL